MRKRMIWNRLLAGGLATTLVMSAGATVGYAQENAGDWIQESSALCPEEAAEETAQEPTQEITQETTQEEADEKAEENLQAGATEYFQETIEAPAYEGDSMDLCFDADEVGQGGGLSSGLSSGLNSGLSSGLSNGLCDDLGNDLGDELGDDLLSDMLFEEEDGMEITVFPEDEAEFSLTEEDTSDQECMEELSEAADLFDAEGLIEDISDDAGEGLEEELEEESTWLASGNSLTAAEMAEAQVITTDQLGATLTAAGTSRRNKKLYRFTPSVTQVYLLRCVNDEATAQRIDPDVDLYTNGVLDGDSMVIETGMAGIYRYPFEAAGVLTAGTDYYFQIYGWQQGDVQFSLQAAGDGYLGIYGAEDVTIEYKGSPAYLDPPQIVTVGDVAGQSVKTSWYQKTDAGYVPVTLKQGGKGALITEPINEDTDFRFQVQVGDRVENRDFKVSIRRLSAQQLAQPMITLTEADFGARQTASNGAFLKFRPQTDMTLRWSMETDKDSYFYGFSFFEGEEGTAIRYDGTEWDENGNVYYILCVKANTDYYLQLDDEELPAGYPITLSFSPDEELHCKAKEYLYAEYGTDADLSVSVIGAWAGSNALTWQWYKKKGDTYRPIEGAMSAAYHIESVVEEGEYRCTVAVGEKQKSIDICVDYDLSNEKLYDFECAAAETLQVNQEISLGDTRGTYAGGGKRSGRLLSFTPSVSGKHTLKIHDFPTGGADVEYQLFKVTGAMDADGIDVPGEKTFDLQAETTYYLLMNVWSSKIGKLILTAPGYEGNTTQPGTGSGPQTTQQQTATTPATQQQAVSPVEQPQEIAAQQPQETAGTQPEGTSAVQTPTPEEETTISKVPSVNKPKAAAKDRITISWKAFKQTKKNKAVWKKVKKVEVQYSTDFTFHTRVSKMVGKNKTSLTARNLKKNTTYYVRIRYTDGAGGYSDWSKVRRVRTKRK